jgi:hypothetical protein
VAIDLTSVADLMQDEFKASDPEVRILAIAIDDATDGYVVKVSKTFYSISPPVDWSQIRQAPDPASALGDALRAATRVAIDALPPG